MIRLLPRRSADVNLEEIVEGVQSGRTRAVSAAISAVEDGDAQAFELLKRIFPLSGGSHVIGITGPPGAGKSTLTDRLVLLARDGGKRVGIVAVDPTSPFSGGAILGDRVRMSRHFNDPGVFIRSMATRGALGGISRATYDAVTILEASGCDVVIIETVGVGQDEIDIVNTAHTSAVVLVPGMGDDVQAIKAGILEIGDIFVVNKADRPGTERLVTELGMMLDLAPQTDGWRPPVIKTIASEGEGVEELAAAIEEHGGFLKSEGFGRKKEILRCRHRIRELWKTQAMDRLFPNLLSEEELQRAAEDMAERHAEPYTLIERLTARLEEKQQISDEAG
jgi:LAO/AO transport system kinase